MSFDDAKLLTNFFRRLREELDINDAAIQELLNRHGYSQETLNIYFGDIEPALEMIESIAQELGLSPEWLAYGIEPKQTKTTLDPAAD